MKLLVDFGNTRFKWAQFDDALSDGGLRVGGVFAHADVALRSALAREWRVLSAIDAVFVASVVAPRKTVA